MGGMGHFPLMPIVGRSKAASGFAVTHPTSKSYVTVAVRTTAKREKTASRRKREGIEEAMLMADTSLNALVQMLNNTIHSRKGEAVLELPVLYKTVPPTAAQENSWWATEAMVSSRRTEGLGYERGRRREPDVAWGGGHTAGFNEPRLSYQSKPKIRNNHGQATGWWCGLKVNYIRAGLKSQSRPGFPPCPWASSQRNVTQHIRRADCGEARGVLWQRGKV